MTTTDLDMLAYDMADLLNQHGYVIGLDAAELRRELPNFIDRIAIGAATRAQERWETTDAAKWTSALEDADEPEFQPGPAPVMTHEKWWTSQGVELGQTNPGAHHWRCPICHMWAGPYRNLLSCKRVGMDHRDLAHDLPAAHRSEARKAARRIAGASMTAAVFDAAVARISAAHSQSTDTVHLTISRIASVMAGYSSARDLVDAIARDGLIPAPADARSLVLELAETLDATDHLTKMGA